MKKVEIRLPLLESQVNQISTQINAISTIMEAITDSNTKTLEKISTVDINSVRNKMGEIEARRKL